MRCFDVSFPFWMKIPRFQCMIHGCSFSGLHADLKYPNDLFLMVGKQPCSLLIFDRTIIVCFQYGINTNFQTNRFFQHLITLYSETHNMICITRMVKQTWFETLTAHLWQLWIIGQCVALTSELENALKDHMKLSSKLVTNILLYWWCTTGSELLNKQLKQLRQQSGKILRCDHTYKAVSTLGVSHAAKWVNHSFIVH